jgi:hypothetical protein
MPNTTGAKSIYSSMKKSQMQKKIDLLEACKMDQNWAIAQIAVYTSVKWTHSFSTCFLICRHHWFIC